MSEMIMRQLGPDERIREGDVMIGTSGPLVIVKKLDPIIGTKAQHVLYFRLEFKEPS